MLRTIGVLLAGASLGISLLLALFVLIVYRIPGGLNFYSFFVLEASVGIAVGLLVGFLQRKKPGVLAVICLLPFPLWALLRPTSLVWVGGRFPAFLIGEVLSLLVAFGVAQRFSRARRGSTGAVA